MLRRVFLIFSALFLASGAIVAAISFSPACVSEVGQQDSGTDKGSKEPDTGHQWVFTAVECGLRTFGAPFVDHPNEISAAVTAVATIFIALYTSALSASTSALRDAAEQQKLDMLESLRIAGDTASAAKKSAEVAEKSLVIANRPRVTIQAPTLCEANECIASPHICFSLRNDGGLALVDKVVVTVKITRGRGGIGLTRPSRLIAKPLNSEIEAGQTLGDYYIRLDALGIINLQEIKSEDTTFKKIIFQIISRDMFGKDYTRQTFPFDFDHGKWVFVPSRLLKAEEEQ